jgi:O-acetyl-ADP-ribose deacetylase (regulator of RNase III)
MSSVQYKIGDATEPRGDGPKVIAHVCNDLGRWGKGFVVALSDRWPVTRERYFAWHRGEEPKTGPFELGAAQFVVVEPELWVANVIGQHGITKKNGVPPARYEAIQAGLERVAAFARKKRATVHVPRIGCGLAGGTWDRVVPLIEQTLIAAGVEVTVYDLAAKVAGNAGKAKRRLTEWPIENWDDYGEHM